MIAATTTVRCSALIPLKDDWTAYRDCHAGADAYLFDGTTPVPRCARCALRDLKAGRLTAEPTHTHKDT